MIGQKEKYKKELRYIVRAKRESQPKHILEKKDNFLKMGEKTKERNNTMHGREK